MKKTAVEWLFKWMIDNKDLIIEERLQAFEEAKEMEKQQIIDAYEVTKFGLFAMTDKGILDTANKSGKQYYNETFKSE